MSRQLSHSQINMYSVCPTKYKYHYHHRLREPVTSAALLFGSALDQCINGLLLDKQKNTVKHVAQYQADFEKHWMNQRINNEFHDLPESLLIVYADADNDKDLLSDSDISTLYDRALELIPQEITGNNKRDSIQTAYGKLAAIKKVVGLENIGRETAKFINLHNWMVMRTKGKLMVSKYYSEILPQIKTVVEVQKKIELTNDDGDSVIGYIDAVLDFGDGAGPRIVDLKTAARAYDDDAADISPQLAVYGHALNISNTAFIVCSKSIKKNKSKRCAVCGHEDNETRAQKCNNGTGKDRCGGAWIEEMQPEASIELIKGTINEVFSGYVLDNYEETLKAIQAEAFPRNFSNCSAFGRKCAYWNKCHNGKSDDLIKV